ncbi:MAG: RNA polymerase-associated protein RapA [Verrucomicrobia bacterium]|nr:MAG: RNA polymerase-associated protein RapA [Verrucomicrobiota bacterium]
MSLNTVGQRCTSETEPELGLGIVTSIDRHRIGIEFPASGEQRLYRPGTSVLRRVAFRTGDTISTHEGGSFIIKAVEDEDGLLCYIGDVRRIREDAISDINDLSSPVERLMAGQSDPGSTFDLRTRALQAQWRFRQSESRGFLGGRVDLIPHQFYLLNEVASRQIPRVLLADEVGLGKTIEACMILQRLVVTGRIKRALILVPETLVHQWFVELLRRFNLWFSIYDEKRCRASESSVADGNPFLDEQLVLTSISFPIDRELRRQQMLDAPWDMVVIDEAHHLEWTPETSNPEYDLAEALADRCHGLLLLTATPTQLGLAGHFARLRLLDPDRYSDFDTFRSEAENYEMVARISGRIIDEKQLTPDDHASLKRIFNRDPERLAELLKGVSTKKPGTRAALIDALLDEHGTGRVMFRNTRANMKGFPKRNYCPAPIRCTDQILQARLRRELEAESSDRDADIRYAFKDDPRTDWLIAFLKTDRKAKVLLICRSQRKAQAIESALKEKTNIKMALFHEGLPLVRRDRNAAWFGEIDGARLLICSEIGSEGRNFQFAHHLVLFDLPLNPGLLEQRLGRLDRIGQTDTIQIHHPYLEGSSQDIIQQWYHKGLDAMETLIHGGNEYEAVFREPLLALALKAGTRSGLKTGALDAFIERTRRYREELTEKLNRGRDRLLELNSFDAGIAGHIIEQVRAVDRDPLLKSTLFDLMDHYGVRIAEHEAGDVFLDPSHAFVEAFPSLPAEGTMVTFDRNRAIQREDITFVTPDHALLWDTLDLLLNSPAGTTSFDRVHADSPNLILEAVYVFETVALTAFHVEQFLSPTPLKVVVDVKGQDLTDTWQSPGSRGTGTENGLHRFLEETGFTREMLAGMVKTADVLARARAGDTAEAARHRAGSTLGSEIQRLVDLGNINDHVRPEEIEMAREQKEHTLKAINQARLRLDSIRLTVEGPA